MKPCLLMLYLFSGFYIRDAWILKLFSVNLFPLRFHNEGYTKNLSVAPYLRVATGACFSLTCDIVK